MLGNSASAASGIDQQLGWPWIVAREMGEAGGKPCTVDHVTVVAMGDRAARYALRRVDELHPDIVILVVGTYLCAVRTVGERVRRRYGERAHRTFRRLEVFFEKRTANRRGAPGRLNRWARRVARRVIGAEAYTTPDDVTNVFEEILRGLSQHEGLPVLVFAEPHWPNWVDRENRDANKNWASVCDRVEVIAKRHHFLWAESNALYASVPDRDALYLDDGVHKSAAGCALQAQSVLAALSAAGLVPVTLAS